jgi:hypothetical protein
MPSAPVRLVQNKPVTTTGTLTAVAVAVEGYLEYRGWIPAPLTGVAMVVTVAVLAVIAHELVTPWTKAQHFIEQGLHLTDADWGRFEVMLEQYGLTLLPRPAAATVTGLAAAVIPAPPGDGMTAGQHAAVEAPLAATPPAAATEPPVPGAPGA